MVTRGVSSGVGERPEVTIVERPATRREAGDELSRRALRRYRQGEFSTVAEAIYAAMRDDRVLTKISLEG